VLENRRIRLTPPGAFNDPFEGNPVEDINFDVNKLVDKFTPDVLEILIPKLKKELVECKSWSVEEVRKNPEEYIQKLIQIIQDHYENNTKAHDRRRSTPLDLIDNILGIVSLAEWPDDLLMWSHYGADHSGFVIGFRTDCDFFADAKYSVRRVRYTDRRPSLQKGGVWRLSFNLTKSSAWRYEQEWRLIDSVIGVPQTDKVDNNEYPIILKEFPPEAVQTVLVGSRIKKNDLDKIRKIMNRPEFEHAELHTSILDPKIYRLEVSDHSEI